MAGFYKPYTTKINEKPVIVYPCVGLEKVLDRSRSQSIEKHLEELYSANNKLLKPGEYHIIILWDEASDDKNANSIDIMSDVWIFDKLDSWGSGPLVDVKIFRNMSLETGMGVSAGDGLLMLGREEEVRRTANSLDEYLSGVRAKLPEDITPKEDFYTYGQK
jgi:hypothetical protein